MNSALLGIVAQRLVRRNCEACKEVTQSSPDEVEIFQKVMGRQPKQLIKSKGCSECKSIGYKGRTAIFEVLMMNSQVRDLIRQKTSEDKLREILVSELGFITILHDGLLKCEQGITTVNEVWRNTLRAGDVL